MIHRRDLVLGLAASTLAGTAFAPRLLAQEHTPEGLALVRAAEAQVGVTVIYDPAYVSLAFPGGDVAPERGVCSDVLIRALRVAHGVDLQAAVNVDMKAAFSSYPKTWGLTRTDRNIDHRRVLNLRRLFERIGADVPSDRSPMDFRPGDVVTSTLPGNLPHLVVVSDRIGPSGAPMVVHNIGGGTRIEDRLLDHQLTGTYRLDQTALDRLKALQAKA